MKKHKRSRIGYELGLPQSTPQTASGNGNLTKPEEIVGGALELIQTAVSIIIPAYNEKAAVASQIVGIQEVIQSNGIRHEIIVIDDGSEDATAEKAIETGARVLRKPENQ